MPFPFFFIGGRTLNIAELIDQINLVADEDFEIAQVTAFMNDAIARINVEADANFPAIQATDVTYTAFPDKWQRALFIPYGAGRIKENDSSQFEYNDWYSQFERMLGAFIEKYTVPDQYKDGTRLNDGFDSDFSTSEWSHLKGW